MSGAVNDRKFYIYPGLCRVEQSNGNEAWTSRGAQSDRNDKTCLYNVLDGRAAMLVACVVGKQFVGEMQSPLGSSEKLDTAPSILV